MSMLVVEELEVWWYRGRSVPQESWERYPNTKSLSFRRALSVGDASDVERRTVNDGVDEGALDHDFDEVSRC